jgi:hypothetical protein
MADSLFGHRLFQAVDGGTGRRIQRHAGFMAHVPKYTLGNWLQFLARLGKRERQRLGLRVS